MSFVLRLIRNDKGQTAVEYGLVAAGIGLAILTALQTFSSSFRTMAVSLIDAIK